MRDATILASATTLALLAAPTLAGATFKVADSFHDYAGIQGENGWFYGYYNGNVPDAYRPGDFEMMNVYDTENDRWWVDNTPGGPLTLVDAVYMHSSVRASGVQWAVRRWVSHIDGPVSIAMDIGVPHAQDGENADGVRLHVFVDGVERLITTLSAENTATISLELFDSVSAGSVIDFAIDPLGNSSFDAVAFNAVITSTVPTPASLALLGIGGLTAARRRR